MDNFVQPTDCSVPSYSCNPSVVQFFPSQPVFKTVGYRKYFTATQNVLKMGWQKTGAGVYYKPTNINDI